MTAVGCAWIQVVTRSKAVQAQAVVFVAEIFCTRLFIIAVNLFHEASQVCVTVIDRAGTVVFAVQCALITDHIPRGRLNAFTLSAGIPIVTIFIQTARAVDVARNKRWIDATQCGIAQIQRTRFVVVAFCCDIHSFIHTAFVGFTQIHCA